MCNFDWKSAGAEDKIKCYSCDSTDGDCDADHAGQEIDCSVEDGCVISTGEETDDVEIEFVIFFLDTNDGKTVFFRGCAVEEDERGCTHNEVSSH